MSTVLIRNGTLIDGTGKTPLADAAVLVRDNIIQQAGHVGSMRQPDEKIIEIDAGSGYILPGMIDTHVHVMLEGVNIARDMVTPFSMRFYNSVQYLKNTIDAGITSVRDAGGADAGTKQAVDSGMIVGPRLQISISVLTITGGHGDGWMRSGMEYDLFMPYPGFPSCRVDGVEDCRRKVREVLRAGADVIKICSTGGVLSPTDHPEFVQFSPEELDIIVREAAYRNGVKVMAHAQGAEGVKNAIRAGIHSIEHGIFLDDEAIELMLKHGTYLVPTLLAPLAVLEAGEKGGMPEYGVRKAREVVEIHSESISRAHKAGVRIAMGTDAGVMAHGTNLRELGLMVNVGMSPMETIVATTKKAAECLGWEDRVGTIEAGKLADIILVKENPLQNVRSLEKVDNIVLVMKDGKVVKDIRKGMN
jgi:imidazolonepropionase-like amidohydrolase